VPRDRRGSKQGSRQGSRQSAKPIKKGKKKHCQFCADKSDYIDYKDIALLRRYVSDRGKIRARRVTGNCTQHQRRVATAIKNAREMALLPYSTR
jgi:small subunit ribosomal protein S18